MPRLATACAVTALLAAATTAVVPVAGARTVSEWHQVLVYSPWNVDAHVGWIAQGMFSLKNPARIKVGGTTYVGPWNNATVTRGTMSEALKEMSRRYAQDSFAIYSDRSLTRAERARFRVSAGLFRDADVLVVSAGHPACAGLTLGQARKIAQGRITRWSQVVAGVPGKIAVRYTVRGGGEELRFGTRLVPRRTSRGTRYSATYAAGAKGAADGGVGAAAKGDRSIAAITSWSAVRGRSAATCIVPLGGVSAGNASVASLRYPGAYPVDIVVRRRIQNPVVRARLAAFVKYMTSAKIRGQLRARGLLVAGDPVPAEPPPAGAAPPDPQQAGATPVDVPPPGAVPVTDDYP